MPVSKEVRAGAEQGGMGNRVAATIMGMSTCALVACGGGPALDVASYPVFGDALFDQAGFPDVLDLAVADFDLDGDLDVALACGSQGAHLLRNDGGTFAAVWTSEGSGTIDAVAWARVDADPWPDLTGGSRSGSAYAWLADPDGEVLQHGQNLADLGGGIVAVSWADVDGDGTLDLAMGGPGGAQLHLGHGDGTVDPAAAWHSSDSGVTAVAWGDPDADGRPWLAVASEERSAAWEPAGGSLLAASSWEGHAAMHVAWGDVDRDGRQDLVTATVGVADVYSWASPVPTTPIDSEAVGGAFALGDVDSDGDLDLVGGAGADLGELLLRNVPEHLLSGPEWVDPSAEPEGRTRILADLAGDGGPELAVGGPDDPTLTVLQAADPRPALAQSVELEHSTRAAAAGDVNGDGFDDLVIAESAGPTLYLGSADGLTAEAAWSGAEEPTLDSFTVALGDLDGDGLLDLATGGQNHAARVYLGLGGTFAEPWSAPTDIDSKGVLIAALDGQPASEGLDLVVTGYQIVDSSDPAPVGLVYRRWTGDGFERTDEVPELGQESYLVAAADVDGDGDLDLAVAGPWASPAQLLRNDGDAGFVPIWHETDTGMTSVAWGDLDGDGRLDLALGSWSHDTPSRVIAGDGVGLGATLWTEPTGPGGEYGSTRAVAWIDIDEDGDPDLATVNAIDSDDDPLLGRDFLWLNDGGELTRPWSPELTEASRGLAAADVDGDGDQDLLVTTERWGSEVPPLVRVLRNGLHGPPLLPNDPPTVSLQVAGVARTSVGPAQAAVLGPDISVRVTLADPEGDAVQALRLQWSPVGGGSWQDADVTMPEGPFAADPAGTVHELTWQLAEDAIVSPHAALRVVATGLGAGTFGDSPPRGSVAAHTPPFPVDHGCGRDGDGDGFYSCLDCDDDDPETFPGQDDETCDGVDRDCDGVGVTVDEEPVCWETGCGCAAAATPGPPAGLLLLPLLVMARRRR